MNILADTLTETLAEPLHAAPGETASNPEEETFAQKLLNRVLPGAVSLSSPRSPQKTRTAAGTPCAKSWDLAWIAQVEDVEERLGHRVCGARTIDNEPCEIESTHPTGRCKFHGGFALTGAVPGNRNSVIHALYSRRLRTCCPHCPMWDSCPCAGPEVMALKARKRPICYYEQLEYDTALTDALARASAMPGVDPLRLHIAHNIALAQVLLSRAAMYISKTALTDTVLHFRETTETRSGYSHDYAKPSAHLVVYTKLANEYRRFVAMLESKEPLDPTIAETINHIARTASDTSSDPEIRALVHADASAGLHQTFHEIGDAIRRAASGRNAAAVESFQNARDLAERYTVKGKEPIIGVYRPDPWDAPPRIVNYLLRHIDGPNNPAPPS